MLLSTGFGVTAGVAAGVTFAAVGTAAFGITVTPGLLFVFAGAFGAVFEAEFGLFVFG